MSFENNIFKNFMNNFQMPMNQFSWTPQPMNSFNIFGNSLFNMPFQNLNNFNNFNGFNSLNNFNNFNNFNIFNFGQLANPTQSFMQPLPLFQFPMGVGNINALNIQSKDVEIQGKEVLLNKKGNGYGKEFLDKVKDISKRLNCNYKDLLGVMNSESGINAKIKNPHGSATGLIQFVESTARELGTTTNELAQMSPVKQLDYVEKYLKNAKRMAGFSENEKLSGGQLYALIFLPGRAKREVLASNTEGNSYYRQNKGLDLNKDGQITKTELNNRIKMHHVKDSSFLA